MTGVAGTGAEVRVPNSSNSLRSRGRDARTRPAPPRVEESGTRAGSAGPPLTQPPPSRYAVTEPSHDGPAAP